MNVQLRLAGPIHLTVELKVILAVVGPCESRYIPRYVDLRGGGRGGGEEGRREGEREGGREG